MNMHSPAYIAACKQVANDWRELAHAIRLENAYAAHVTEETKQAAMDKMLLQADAIERGEVNNFTIAQRVHYAMTGECVALLA